MASKFDLENELIAASFTMTEDKTFDWDRRYRRRTYSKDFHKMARYAWAGELEFHFLVDVQIMYFNGKPCMVTASYSNGKVKEHDYGKRAYNAIRDTVKNNGFEIYD